MRTSAGLGEGKGVPCCSPGLSGRVFVAAPSGDRASCMSVGPQWRLYCGECNAFHFHNPALLLLFVQMVLVCNAPYLGLVYA